MAEAINVTERVAVYVRGGQKVTWAVNRIAQELGVSPSTVWRRREAETQARLIALCERMRAPNFELCSSVEETWLRAVVPFAPQTPVDETVKAFRALWGKASPSARAAILNDLAGRKLPAGYSLTEAG